jgi:hypothetical protein
MRRTPIFLNDENNPIIVGPFLVRPSTDVGDYLENRRVLRALNDKYHFEELESVIDNDETLDALYLFDGTRFIKDKVVNLFDNSEYSFPSMLGYLLDSFLDKLNFPLNKDTDKISGEEKMELIRDFLLNYQDFYEFESIVELSEFILSDISAINENKFSNLIEYSSDQYFVRRNFENLSDSLRAFQDTYGRWNYYIAFSDFAQPRKKSLLNAFKSREKLLLDKSFLTINNKLNSAAKLVERGVAGMSVVNYILRLSACMNLPDDKHAQFHESKLVDEWLELFNNFYPQYEKLKAWYIREKERSHSDLELANI